MGGRNRSRGTASAPPAPGDGDGGDRGEPMAVEVVAIADLHLDPANVRKHPARNLATIKASLARFGQQKPIIIDANNVVRAGNGTLLGAMDLGWDSIKCVRTGLCGTDATAYSIADNQSALQATWDDDALALTLRALQDEDFDLDAVGFTDAEVDALFGTGDGDDAGEEKPEAQEPWQGRFEIVIELASEAEQQEVYERLTAEGLKCRVLTM
jgi:ParB-like chromosome segregation protein Spo0J